METTYTTTYKEFVKKQSKPGITLKQIAIMWKAEKQKVNSVTDIVTSYKCCCKDVREYQTFMTWYNKNIHKYNMPIIPNSFVWDDNIFVLQFSSNKHTTSFHDILLMFSESPSICNMMYETVNIVDSDTKYDHIKHRETYSLLHTR